MDDQVPKTGIACELEMAAAWKRKNESHRGCPTARGAKCCCRNCDEVGLQQSDLQVTPKSLFPNGLNTYRCLFKAFIGRFILTTGDESESAS